jgi:ADP-ribose pyrophosphatase YjhB (NUDIX family)
MEYIPWIRSLVGHAPVILNFAIGVVTDEAGRVLLQRRGDRTRDVWGFPGGGVELGESLEATTVREVFEETGLKVRPTALIGVYSAYQDSYPNGDQAQTISTVFACEIESGHLRADGVETVGLDWFALDQLPDLLNTQHQHIASDLRSKRVGVWR